MFEPISQPIRNFTHKMDLCLVTNYRKHDYFPSVWKRNTSQLSFTFNTIFLLKVFSTLYSFTVITVKNTSCCFEITEHFIIKDKVTRTDFLSIFATDTSVVQKMPFSADITDKIWRKVQKNCKYRWSVLIMLQNLQ